MVVVTILDGQATSDVEGNYDLFPFILHCYFLFLLFCDVTESIGMDFAHVTVDSVVTVRESSIVFSLTVGATMDILAGFLFLVELASKGLELTMTILAFNLLPFHFAG